MGSKNTIFIDDFASSLRSDTTSSTESDILKNRIALVNERQNSILSIDRHIDNIEGLMSTYESLNSISEREFIYVLPSILRIIVHHSDDPRVLNVYGTVIGRLCYGPDRWSVLHSISEASALKLVEAVTSIGANFLDDEHVDQEQSLMLEIISSKIE